MPNTCTVCMNNARKTKDKSYFSYPRDQLRRHQWLRAVDREDLIGKIDRLNAWYGYKICEHHFEPDQIKYSKKKTVKYLAKNAFPTLNLPDVTHKKAEDFVVNLRHPSVQASNQPHLTDAASKLIEIEVPVPSKPCGVFQLPKTGHLDLNKVTNEDFLKLCDKFLTSNMSQLIKSEIDLETADRKRLPKEAKGMDTLNVSDGTRTFFPTKHSVISSDFQDMATNGIDIATLTPKCTIRSSNAFAPTPRARPRASTSTAANTTPSSNISVSKPTTCEPRNKRRCNDQPGTPSKKSSPNVFSESKCVCCLEREAKDRLWAPRAHVGSYGHVVKLLFDIEFPVPEHVLTKIRICGKCQEELELALRLRTRLLAAQSRLRLVHWPPDTTGHTPDTIGHNSDNNMECTELPIESEDTVEQELDEAQITMDIEIKTEPELLIEENEVQPISEASSSSECLPLAAIGQTAEGTRTRTGQRHFKYKASLKTADHTNGSNAGPNQRVDDVEVKVEPQDIKLEPDPLGEVEDPSLEKFEPRSWS